MDSMIYTPISQERAGALVLAEIRASRVKSEGGKL